MGGQKTNFVQWHLRDREIRLGVEHRGTNHVLVDERFDEMFVEIPETEFIVEKFPFDLRWTRSTIGEIAARLTHGSFTE